MTRTPRWPALMAAAVLLTAAACRLAAAAAVDGPRGTPSQGTGSSTVSISGVTVGGDSADVAITIVTPVPLGDQRMNYRIGLDVDADGVADRWVVVDFDAAAGGVRAGIGPAGSGHLTAATVTRLTGYNLTVTFPRALLGGATGFGWVVDAVSPGASGAPAAVVAYPDPPTVGWPEPVRIGGQDRIATAVASSFVADQAASAVVLARSDDFADALSGAPLAVSKGAPLLLTPPASLDPRTLAEIERCLPPGGTVYLLGGTSALSSGVEDAVRTAGYGVVRMAGADRYATSLAVLQQGLGAVTTVLLADGTGFADALAAGAAAGARGGAVLLTDGDVLPVPVASYLEDHPVPVYAIGGPAVTADPNALAVAGDDRYATAAAVAATFFSRPSVVGVVSGTSYADALVGGATVAEGRGPLLLSAPQSLSAPTAGYLMAHPGASVLLFGGTAALSNTVANDVNAALGAINRARSRS